MSKPPERVEVLRMEDSTREAVKIILPQLGSDGAKLAEQEIDERRFTRLDKAEIIPVMYFSLHRNDWIKRAMLEYKNLKMSEAGHERAVLVVEALKALGGGVQPPKKKKDERNWIGRNITQRNKGPDDQE